MKSLMRPGTARQMEWTMPRMAQHCSFGLADDAHGEQIEHLVDGDLLVGELLLDGVEPLDAPLDAAGNLEFGKLASSCFADAAEEDFAFVAQRFDLGRELLVGEGIGVAEGEVFELAAQFAHAQPVRQRSEDVERLLRDFLALFGLQVLQRAHVVQAVGELDDDHADIGDHGEQHFADVLRLMVFAIGKLDLVQLGDAFDDVRDLLAEEFFNLLGGDIGVFDRIVQQTGGDGGRVHLEFGEDEADLQRMDGVRLARGALLAFVLGQAEGPGFADDFQIVAGPVLVDLLLAGGQTWRRCR